MKKLLLVIGVLLFLPSAFATEQLANLASTSVASTQASGATTLVVASATGFPSTGNFTVGVDTYPGASYELERVTAVSGTTFTVTRYLPGGAQSPTSHAPGATVTLVASAETLNSLNFAPTPAATCGDTSHASAWNGSAWTCQAINSGTAAPGGSNGQLQYNNSGAMGGVSLFSAAMTLGFEVYYNAANQLAPVTGKIHTLPYLLAGGTSSDPIHAAFANCPNQVNRTPSMSIVPSVNNGSPTMMTDPNGNLEIAFVAGTASSGANNTITWPAGGTIGAQTNDGTGTWISGGYGILTTEPCTVIVDTATTSYPLPSPLLIGITNGAPQTLRIDNGATIAVTDQHGSGGQGGGGLVEGTWGHIIGESTGGVSISGGGLAKVDALVETFDAYFYSNGLNCTTCANSGGTGHTFQQTGADIQGMSITGGSQINRAMLWFSSVDGTGLLRDIQVGSPPQGGVGILIDDSPLGTSYGGAWNSLTLNNVSTSMGSGAYGVVIICSVGTGSGVGAGLTWTGRAGSAAGNANAIAHIAIFGGSAAACGQIHIDAPYFESGSGESTASVGILLSGVNNIDINNILLNSGGGNLFNGIQFNGSGSATYLVDGFTIAASSSYPINGVRVYGRCTTGVCSNDVIQNYKTGYVWPGTGGNFDYYVPSTANGSNTPTIDGVRNQPPVAVNSLPTTCTAGDQRPVTNWNGTIGVCSSTGGTPTYVVATCGASNTWYCP